MNHEEALRGQKRDEPAMDMTPMIDVTFQLLVFFMCTIKFKTLEGKLSAYLPKDAGVVDRRSEVPEKVDIVLRVVREGTRLDPHGDAAWSGTGPFRYGPDRRVEVAVGPRKMADSNELGARLAEFYRARPERGATIDARPGTVYADVVGVLDRAIEAGFTDIAFKGSRTDRAR